MNKLKLYILARKDAPIGKVMAHIGHVCYKLIMLDFDSLLLIDQSMRIESWYGKYGKEQTKIVLAVKNQAELEKFKKDFNVFENNLRHLKCMMMKLRNWD